MASYGVVSIVKNGEVRMKILATCRGKQALALGRVIDLRRRIPFASAVHAEALRLGFGCPECLVVADQDNVFTHAPDRQVSAAIRSTLQLERFNPRSPDGHAEHAVVVTISTIAKRGGKMPRASLCRSQKLHDMMRTASRTNVSVRFCKDCGGTLNPEAKVIPNCAQHHSERRAEGEKYCPDCGVKL